MNNFANYTNYFTDPLKERIDTPKMQEPSFMMILSATNIGYTRKDGIYVVPIGSLKW